MNHEKYERRYAQIGRALATNLKHWAKERDSESKKAAAHNQTELCHLHTEELVEAQEFFETKNGESS